MCEPSIAAFCMLIKLWAKRVNIINSQHPMKGLSSYGIALMSLYYLMESKQINFISLCPKFDLDIDVINPNLNNCKLKNL
jgi:DNA polymerase sigma